MSVIETTRLVGKDLLKTYLPQVDASNLPALSGARVSDSSEHSYSKEREALYKLLFEMKAEINALKESAANEKGLNEKIQNDYPVRSHELPRPSSTGQEVTIISDEEREQFDDNHTIEIENLSLVDKEIELIKKALEKSGGKRKHAAKELGISERTLYRKIKQYNLE
jgi:DNA-binding NtrC family response regulator